MLDRVFTGISISPSIGGPIASILVPSPTEFPFFGQSKRKRWRYLFADKGAGLGLDGADEAQRDAVVNRVGVLAALALAAAADERAQREGRGGAHLRHRVLQQRQQLLVRRVADGAPRK